MKNKCVYLGAETGSSYGKPDIKVHRCQLHDLCVQTHGDSLTPECSSCTTRLALDDATFAETWQDPLIVQDQTRRPSHALRGLLRGGSVFLVCGGPSMNSLPLEGLNQRGCWTMTVNNVGGHHRFRPQAFVCNDPPSKFSHSIWLDPAIMKFTSTVKLHGGRGSLWVKENGKFKDLIIEGKRYSTNDCPNVWGVGRRSWLLPDETFFLDPEASVGNYAAGVTRTGEDKTVCTMLMAMRLCRYLGARRVFMVGVDFHMDPTKSSTENYSFGERRNLQACVSNNNQYHVVNRWLCSLQEKGIFSKFGIEFFNCNPHSALRAFDYVPFDVALKDVRGLVEEKPDLIGWYEKKKDE